ERRRGLLEELADHVELALEASVIVHSRSAPDEHLLDIRLDRECRGAEQVTVGGDVAPAEQPRALLLDDRVEERPHLIALLWVPREEHETAAVLLRPGQGDGKPVTLPAKELVSRLDHNAGAPTGA